MAGDKKGKSKMVVQKKKKRTREDREREQAHACIYHTGILALIAILIFGNSVLIVLV